MELYGSLLNISGSVTASAFTGSFIGDASGLTGIQASGVTGLNLSQISSGNATASISTTGFTVNKNTQIQGNLSVTGSIIANEYIVSSSVIYMTTSFASGSSAFGNDNNDVHQFTGSVQITGSISLNGQAIGTGKLDETTFQSYTSSNNSRVSLLETSSGSLNSFTSSINTTIKSKLDSDNVISGSVQVNITGTTGYSTFSSSISNSIDNLSSSVATTTSGLSSSIGSVSSSIATTTSGLSSSIGSLSSSIATTDSNQEGRLNALETSSGSLNSFTSSIDTTIKNKLNNDGVISGSSQILNGSNIVSSSTQVTAYGFATTGSNLFKGTQTHSGSILPSVDNTYDLGSVEYQWRDVYISSGSLYIDGTKVLSSTAQELTITTDNGQSLKILEGTTDSIVIQTADGDIELKSSADGDILLDPTNGKIMLKGPVEVLSGQKIQSSVGGTPVVFANDIVVSGSIDLTGTIDGIDLQSLSSSLNTRIGGIETATGSLNSYTSSNTTNINAIHTSTSSLNSFTSSINTTIKSKLDNDSVISGSVQVILTGTTGYSAFSSSVSTSIGTLSGSIATTTSGLSSSVDSLSSSVATTTSGLTSTITSLSSSVSSSIGSLSSSVATTTSGLTSTITSLSSSVATTTSGLTSTITSLSSSVATTTLNQGSRLTSIEGKTGSYATTGSNIYQGDQTITGSLYVSQNLIVAGSSSIQHISSSVVNIADNIITVNAQNPALRFGGLAVIDSGSSPQVSGSLLFDATENEWIFVHQNQSAVTSALLIMGPETYNDLGNEIHLTNNRLVKSTNDEHVGDSNITDTGTKVSVNSNTEITGSLTVAGGNKITVNGVGGDEGGEILLGKATTNTTLAGEGVTIDVWQNRLRIFEQGGSARGAYLDISSLANGVGTNLLGTAATASYVEYSNVANKPALVSGSSQISFLSVSNIPSGLVSGSSQVLNGSGVWSGSAQLPSGVVSGSSQVLAGTGIWSGSAQLPSGVVSGSSQISFGSITGVPSGLVSGSSQVLAGTTIHSGSFFNGISVVSGSAQISFNGITDKPTLVSGSSQISFGSISSIPGGLVSGSSQIDLTATTNYASGILTRLNAVGVFSGSAQVTLSSTTGYGSVINQAVLTTSSPTFAGLTSNGVGVFNSTNDTQISLRSTDTWAGIEFDDSGTADYLWYNGGNQTFSIGGGGGNVSGKKLHVHGGMTIGASYTSTSTPANGLNVEGNTTVGGTISASNLSGTNTGDQTLSGLGGLSNNTDSEQTIGGKAYYFNSGAGRMNADPRWNESGYDADLGCLHLWSWTAAGAAYGRAGIAFYNDNAYQYLTTKSNTTGLFVNNSLIATAGSSPTFASVTGTITSSGSGDSNAPFRFSADYSGWMSIVAGAPGSNNGWGLFWAGNASAQYGTNGAGGPGNIWSNADNPNEYVFVGNGGSRMSIYGNNGNVWMGGDVRMDGSVGVGVSPALKFHVRGSNEMVRFENTSTTSGQYCQLNIRAGNRNGYIWLANENTSSWAGAGGMNIYTENGNIDFWSNAVQRVRIQTDGHMVPYANNSYDLGSSSLGWRNVYTNDLHLSNMNKPEGNDVDGTNGNWTIQEGAENLYIINNNNGKKFKIKLEEI
jgi:hypothetical protein